MVTARRLRVTGWNLLLGSAAGTAAIVLVGALVVAVAPPSWMQDATEDANGLSAAAFQFVVLLPAVALGVGLHQLMLLAFPRSLTLRQRRVIGRATAVVVVAPLFLWSAGSVGLLLTWRGVIPLAAGVVVYAALTRFVDSDTGLHN